MDAISELERTAMGTTKEEWRPVMGYEGYYEVSDHGRVRSVTRTITSTSRYGLVFLKTMKGTIINSSSVGNGYPGVRLYRNGQGRCRKISVMMLEAFVGPRPAKHDACHNDGIRANNVLSNLRWDTRKGNFSDKKKHGTFACGSKANGAKLTECDVIAIRASTASDRIVAARFGVGASQINRIRRRLRWEWL